jgi:hypothetical protein
MPWIGSHWRPRRCPWVRSVLQFLVATNGRFSERVIPAIRLLGLMAVDVTEAGKRGAFGRVGGGDRRALTTCVWPPWTM